MESSYKSASDLGSTEEATVSNARSRGDTGARRGAPCRSPRGPGLGRCQVLPKARKGKFRAENRRTV